MKPFHLAALSACLSLLAVVATTTAVVHFASTLNGLTLIPGLADIRFALNRGVSFSLMAQQGPSGAFLLAAGTAVLIAVLCVWAWRTNSPRIGIALGVMIGGALYNTADRALHGGVFDFLFLHIGAFALFVCNTADIAITIGVLILLLDSIGEGRS